jgi:circadian clock protein KaiC
VIRENRRNRHKPQGSLKKDRTGIPGFDEITRGGLPAGRPTLVCGSAGAGKTLFAMEFLVRGATLFDEPGVFMSFEESDEELATNVASLGFDLKQLIADKKLVLATPSTQSERSVLFSTLSKHSSPRFPTKPSSAPSSAVCFAG